MSDIQLNIQINNSEGTEIVIINSNKQILINNSNYFEALFSNKFNDSKKSEIDIDLTNDIFICDPEYIKNIFKYLDKPDIYNFIPKKENHYFNRI